MRQKLNPLQLQTALKQAVALHVSGETAKAKAVYRQLLNDHPRNADVLRLLGTAECQLGNLEESVNLLGKSLEISPGQPDVHNNRGNALKALGRFEEALASYDRAIAIKPDFAEAYFNRGIALQELDRHREALPCYDKALAIRPDYAEACNNRGIALMKLQRVGEAIACFDRALAIRPNHAEAYCNRGDALQKLNRPEQALASYDRALAIRPDYAKASGNRGNALLTLKRFEEALASYDKALAIRPDYAEAYNSRGATFQAVGRLDEALASYDRALAISPDYAEAHKNRGTLLKELGRLDETLASYARALAIRPDYEFLAGSLLYTMRHLCDWNRLEERTDSLLRSIADNKKVSLPYIVLGLTDNGSIQRKCSEIFTTEMFRSRNALAPAAKFRRHRKIRIGYFSADFLAHPVMHLAAELFERHDRNLFETVAFSLGPDTGDEWCQRAKRSFDKFIDVRHKSDLEVALLARNLELDIAIDLNGHTQGARTGIFTERAAPVQVNYLGYPGTMGAEFMDYIIADSVIIPKEQRDCYSEKIVYLPASYMPNCRNRHVSGETLRREDHGLPSDGFVFSSFNNNYKLTPAVFGGWMRILQKVENSVLWLVTSNRTAENNLRKEAEARGVAASRLIFARKIPGEQYLNRLRLADLMLDSFPFCAHTTCSDALRMGLPVITRTGESFASRAAASLLTTIGLPELITATQEEYELLATDLATHPVKLAQIKADLIGKVKTSPLYDSERYTRRIESAFVAMYERHQKDLPPEDLFIAG